MNVLECFKMLRLYQLNSPTSGNASDRDGITETGCNADMELKLVTWSSITKSQDAPIHSLCYQLRDDFQAILHAHSPYTVAVDSFQDFGPESFRYAVIEADWRTEKEEIGRALAKYGLVLHRNHGVYAAAERAYTAYEAICTLEHAAKTAYIRAAFRK